jgi:uncharacterized membrane protein YdbT with pleckstrin-like domain
MVRLGMNPLDTLGRLMLLLGGLLAGLGLLLLLLGRFPMMGRLPGDFSFKWGNATCYFPLMTGIVLSIVATVVLNLIVWLLRK